MALHKFQKKLLRKLVPREKIVKETKDFLRLRLNGSGIDARAKLTLFILIFILIHKVTKSFSLSYNIRLNYKNYIL